MPSSPPDDSLAGLRDRLREFADERDWQRFHTPKNLALALTGEVGELASEVQWLTDEQAASLSSEQRAAIQGEIADVLIYLVRFAETVGVDPVAAAHAKTDLNALRFPVVE